MLILILPATFIVVFFCLQGYHHNQRTPFADWRMSVLQSAALLGGYMVLFSELLSLFHALTAFWVAVFWGVAFVFSMILGWRSGWILEEFHSLKTGWTKPGWFDILAGTIVMIILTLLFIVAVKSPINNNDSLQYHMSRVMHWVQNHSLQHYATSFVPQLIHPLWAELAILNIRLLSGTDQFVNLLQWFSLAGGLVAISAVTKILDRNKAWLWGSIAFALSLPAGILEATSTQNDLVVAFWTICLLFFIFRGSKTELHGLDFFMIGSVLGLGMLTKGTFFPYAAAPMVYFITRLFRTGNLKKTFKAILLVSVIAILLNLGNWSRNIITFGTPLGSKAFVSKFASNTYGPIQIMAGLSRNITQNFATPNESLNNQINLTLQSIFGNYDPASASFQLEWGWNHEDIAGNPLHILLIFASTILLLILRKKINQPIIWAYMLVVLFMFFLLAVVVNYDPYGIRYQLPLYMAWAPLIGASLGILERKYLNYIIILLLLLSAFPWVLFNRTRPLIAMRDSSDPYTIPCYAGCTVGSILIEPPEKTMFAVWGSLGDAYVDAMQLVKSTGCQDIGLKLDSHDLEYAYWWLLGAPQNGMRLESIVTYPELERYLDPDFKPCVIICSTCGEQSQLFGLERIGSFGEGRIKIFSGENYNPNNP
jgi:hypothetical protein